MEDAVTDIPPPSRFFQEDLNNFTPPSSPLPSPFLVLANPNHNDPFCPSLLIIAISSPSLYLLQKRISKTLIGTLIVPEIPFSGNSIEPSLTNKSCNIYALDNDRSVLIVTFQCSVAAERSHAVAKLLIDRGLICPERVLILDSVQSRNFRGKLSPDETFTFKLETSEQRSFGSMVKDLDYFPSGSMIDGLAASLLARCQMRKIKATLCASWPESGGLAVLMLRSLLKDVLPNLNFSSDDNEGLDRIRDPHLDSELYT